MIQEQQDLIQTTIDRWHDADVHMKQLMQKPALRAIHEGKMFNSPPLQCICLAIITSFRDEPELDQNLTLRIGATALLWLARRMTPNRPGWNDFHMVRWLMLRRADDFHEIMRRSTLPLGPVGDSCRWMVDSMREQNKDFAIAVARYSGYATNNTEQDLPLGSSGK